MELINSRYKILECLEEEHHYRQYMVSDLMKKGEKVLLYLVTDTQMTRPFIEYCNSNFYEISSYKQENIMNIYSYGIVETMDDKQVEETTFFYTTEYIHSITLLDIKKPLDKDQILSVYQQLSHALDFLYYHGIVYKYLGVETIRFIEKDGRYAVKLLDLISMIRIEKMKTYFHSLTGSFLAPELSNGVDLSVRSDIYSLGALIYYLLTLEPFEKNLFILNNQDYANGHSFEIKILNVIMKMTSNEIDNRYSTIHECNEVIQDVYGIEGPIENLKDVDKINFKISLIGRDSEIHQILDVCEIRQDGIKKFNKSLVLINGDKGIGKTRLINEISYLIRWKKYKSFPIAIHREGESFKSLMGNLLKQFIKVSPESYILKYGKELIKLVPELGMNRDILPSATLPDNQEELRLYDRVANFICDVSSINPCVVLLDDFHLVDRSTVDFIEYLMNLNKIKKAPLLLILGYSDESFYLDENKENIYNWSHHNALHIKLSRLTIEETAKMIQHILGWHKNPLNFASRIMKDTEGNPSYIEEVMKELYSQGLVKIDYSTKYKGFAPIVSVDDYNQIILSQNIDESMLKQVSTFDHITREILDVVSLFNTAISKDIIGSMLGLEINQYNDYFLKLTQLKILNEKFDDWGYTYGFYNKDFKKYIYDNIKEDRRATLHIKASNILEELYIKEGRENKDELIYHLIQSSQKDKSVDYCIQSGVGMLKFFIYEQADTFFKQAYELLQEDSDPRKLTVLMHLGEVSQNLSKYNDAIDYFKYAVKLADLQKWPKKYILAKNKIGLLHSIRNEFDLAQIHLTESIHKAQQIQYMKGAMQAAYLLGRVYMQTRELQKMKVISDEYFNYAVAENDLYYMGMFIGLRGIVEYFEENIESALEFFTKSVEYLEQSGNREETARSINNIGVIYNDHYQDTKTARIYFQKALDISVQYRKTDGIITFSNNVADTHMAEHGYQKAIDVLKKNLELALEYGEEISTLVTFSNLIISYTHIGEYKQARTYLLRAHSIYNNRRVNTKGIYLETYLEACAKLYMEMGAYDKALEIIKEFFHNFAHAEPSIQLRMRKLNYFAKHYAGKSVEEKELLLLIEEYRTTPYVRDRRMALLEGVDYFINRAMLSEAKILLTEDNSLSSIVSNHYFVLKRKYLESFLWSIKEQIVILEDLLLDQNLDQFKEIQWKVYAQIGVLYLQLGAYFRSINNFLNALDAIYVLFNKTPFEFKKEYLLKDHKFIIRRNLFKIEKMINGERNKKMVNFKDWEYEQYKDQIIHQNKLKDFFDIVELKNILKNPKFYDLAVEHYDKVNQTKVRSINQLVATFTDHSIHNLNLLLQLVCRTTLASRGVIMKADGYQVITSVGQSISEEKISRVLENISTATKEIFSKGGLIHARDFSREHGDRDIRALICLPIYRKNTNVEDSSFQEQNRKQFIGFQEKVIGYLYLETDKALNNFSDDALEFCKNLLPLASILLMNHNLTIFSYIDKMTGAYVRKYFEQVFAEEIERTKLVHQPLSIIMIDVDHFKNINDIYGHQKGDIVLTEIGKIIMGSIRSTDYLGRYGGEEFIVLLTGATKEDAYKVAEKIRNRVENSKLLGDDTRLTISCGIASFPQDADKEMQIVEKADQALYYAKENGRNKSIVWKKDIVLGSKRVDKLAGVVTGNIVHDQRNVLVITEIIELISKNSTLQEKIFVILGRLIEILEAEDGILFTVDGNKIKEKYYRRRFIEEWVPSFLFNEDMIHNVMQSMKGRYSIDWENMSEFDALTNAPNWKSVIVVPIIVNENLCGIIYLSVPIKEKEFGYNAYNLVEITSKVIGAILKTTNNIHTA